MTYPTQHLSCAPIRVANRASLMAVFLLAACSSIQTPPRQAPDEPTPLRVAYYVVNTTSMGAPATAPKAPSPTADAKADRGAARASEAPAVSRGQMLTPAALKGAIPNARAFEEAVWLEPSKEFESEQQRDTDLLMQARSKRCDVCVVFEIAEDLRPSEKSRAGEISWNTFFGGFPNLFWMNEAVFECAGRIHARAYSVASFRADIGLPRSFESNFHVPDVVLTPGERVGGLGWWLGLALPTCWTPTDNSVVENSMKKRAPEALQQHGLRGWAHQELLANLEVDVRMVRDGTVSATSNLRITPRDRLTVTRIELRHQGQKTLVLEPGKENPVEAKIPADFAPTKDSPTQVTVFLSDALSRQRLYSFTFTR